MLRGWAVTAIIVALTASATSARADRGDVVMGVDAGWTSRHQVHGTAMGTVGLSDAWAWQAELGARRNDVDLWRPMAVTGVTWAYDVTSYVPAVTLAAGVTYPDREPAWLGVGRVALRRFVSTHSWAALAVSAEVTRGGWHMGASAGFFWQL